MCKSELHDFLRRLPKAEHVRDLALQRFTTPSSTDLNQHLHLEGTLEPELLFRLAEKHGVSLPADDPAFSSPSSLAQRYQAFSSLDDFLSYYYIGMSVLVDQDDFEALAWNYFTRASTDGVHHAEVFFDPQAHISRGVAYSAVVEGFRAAQQRASEQLSMSTELICCFLRHLPAQDALETFKHEAVQQSFADGHVIGIGLDSSELDFPPHLFTDVYEQARRQGLRLTAHAGEEGSHAYVSSALDNLNVARIDHGVKAAHSQDLLARLAKEEVLLSVCPISNVYLRGVGHVRELPIREFLDSGVIFSINSDDPAYFGGNYILDNYCAIQEAFELTVDEWRKIAEGSVRGSWISERRKEELLAAVNAAIQNWQSG